MKTIRELTNRVEEAHTRHLREVKSLEDQTKSASTAATSSANGNGVVGGGDDVSFEALVQGQGSQSKTLTPDLFSSEIGSSNPPSPARMTPPLAATSAQPPSNRSSFGSSHGGGGSGWHNTSTQSTLMPTLSPSSSPMRLPQPTTTTATIMANASPMNTTSRSSHMTSSTTSSLDWSMSNNKLGNSSIPSLAAPPSFQSTPALPPPSSITSTTTNTMAPTSSGPNYNALRGMGATMSSSPSLTPTTLTPNTSRPSSMTTLQPLSMNNQSSGQPLQPQSGRKSNNLMAFDPLG